MDKYSAREITDKIIWEKFVLANKPLSFLQSWNWGETNQLSGDKVVRIGFYKSSVLVGVCQIIRQTAKRGSHFLIPGGPLIDWKNNQLVKFFVQTIRQLAKDEGVWFVRIRPELQDNSQHRQLLNKLGFISAPMHLNAENTWVLDVSKGEAELLAGMRKTTRYLIRKSLKENLIFEISLNPSDAQILYKLQKETVERHHFIGFPLKLFSNQLVTFGQDNQGVLCLCIKDKKVLAAAIIIFYGNIAYYHHSGSTSSEKRIPFSYFLQWKIIEEAKRRGCNYYNFWGIASNDNPKHRFAGVTLFKKGFGGKQVDWLHAHDLPISLFYWLTYVFETLRRLLRGL